eukprot:NODE_13_length_54415_cov_0.522424.p32 type:complete len:224 gc:universal NODE_13_length_54415_cov_0.522424:22000-22671(+)
MPRLPIELIEYISAFHFSTSYSLGFKVMATKIRKYDPIYMDIKTYGDNNEVRNFTLEWSHEWILTNEQFKLHSYSIDAIVAKINPGLCHRIRYFIRDSNHFQIELFSGYICPNKDLSSSLYLMIYHFLTVDGLKVVKPEFWLKAKYITNRAVDHIWVLDGDELVLVKRFVKYGVILNYLYKTEHIANIANGYFNILRQFDDSFIEVKTKGYQDIYYLLSKTKI